MMDPRTDDAIDTPMEPAADASPGDGSHRWTEFDVDLGDVTIHVTRAGSASRPPVVLVHGFTDSGRCWEQVAAALESDHDVVMVDARNHGRSSTANGGAAELAADLAGVIDALGLHRPVIIGHSIGARTAAQVAVARPDLVSALVLEDPPWRDEHEDARDGDGTSDDSSGAVLSHLQSLAAMSVTELEELGRTRHADWPAREYPAWVASKQQVRPEGATALDVVAWGPVVRAIPCPTALLCGDPGRGAIVTPEVAQRVVASNHRLLAHRIPDAGHNIRRENLPAFLDVVRGFMASVRRD